ncbi:MAG: PilZ domain-containing protein [Candidatus Methylomirabilales bacterium]
MTSGPERRRGRRVPVAGRPEGRVKATLDARLLDLSSCGARIEHYNLLRPGFTCTLEFPASLAPLTLSVQIVRSVVVGHDATPTGERLLRYESGLAFLRMTAEQQKLVDDILERLDPGASLGNGRLIL